MTAAPRVPTRSRIRLVPACLALAAGAAAGRADEPRPPLTEAGAVELALARPGLDDVLSGRAGLAHAEALDAGRWPDPVLEWSRERAAGGSSASTEQLVWLDQEIDLSGRQGLRRSAADQRRLGAGHEAEALRAEVRAGARRLFYQVLHAQQRVEVVSAWSERVGRLASAVAARHEAGDAAGYDRRRIEQELALAEARLSVERGALARARAELHAAIATGRAPGGEGPVVAGDLLPAEPLAPPHDLLAAAGSSPALRARRSEIESYRALQRAADRWWIPAVQVGVGYKVVDAPGESLSGELVRASVELPLSGRARSESLRARSGRRLAEGHERLEREELEGRVRGLWHEARSAFAAAAALGADARDRAARLVETAGAAYHGGELGVLELVDAHRNAAEVELRRLELAASARSLRIELDRLTGEVAP